MSEQGQAIIAKVRELAAASPDFVYQPPLEGFDTCFYYWEGKPSCIIGQALDALGIIKPALEHSEGEANSDSVGQLLRKLGLDQDLSAQERAWLSDVQYHQDKKKPWGQAVSNAEESWPDV